MNIYQIPMKCDLCGGGGMSSIKDAGKEWFGAIFTHSDPRICQYYLKKQKKELKELREKVGTP